MKRLLSAPLMSLAMSGVCFAPTDGSAPGAPDVPPAPPAPPAPVDLDVTAAERADAAAATKVAKEAQKAAAKAKRDEEAAAKKVEKDAAALKAKEGKEAEKKAKEDAKAKTKTDAEAAKNAQKMPEQNGVRRPKAETLCGKAWAIFDAVSAKNQATASISESMVIAKSQDLNEANVRAEYARWRKFYGVTGRVAPPKPLETPAPLVAPVDETPPAPPAPATQDTVPTE